LGGGGGGGRGLFRAGQVNAKHVGEFNKRGPRRGGRKNGGSREEREE